MHLNLVQLIFSEAFAQEKRLGQSKEIWSCWPKGQSKIIRNSAGE